MNILILARNTAPILKWISECCRVIRILAAAPFCIPKKIVRRIYTHLKIECLHLYLQWHVPAQDTMVQAAEGECLAEEAQNRVSSSCRPRGFVGSISLQETMGWSAAKQEAAGIVRTSRSDAVVLWRKIMGRFLWGERSCCPRGNSSSTSGCRSLAMENGVWDGQSVLAW